MSSSSPPSSVVSDSEEPDYTSIEIPAKPPEEFSYVERRADLLQQIQSVGHPRILNQNELADRYGVSQQQISSDFDKIATHVRERCSDHDRRALVVDSVVDRSVRGLLEDDEWRKAAQTILEWDEWARENYELERMEARIEALEATDGAEQ